MKHINNIDFTQKVMIIKKSWLIGGMISAIIAAGIEPITNHAIAQPQPENTTVEKRLPSTFGAKSQIQLITPGAQPRQKLRFQAQPGSEETADMTMKMDMSMAMNGNPAPSLEMPGTSMKLNAVVNKVDPNGDIHYGFSYSDVNLVGESTLPPTVLANMQSEMKKIEKFRGNAIVDPMGRTKKANFVTPDNFNPALKQMMDQMASSIEQMSAQLPQAAIGKGGKWQVTSQISLNGMNVEQTATYELVDIQGDVATMNISLVQKAPGIQKMELPQMPQGMTMTLQSYNAIGSGQAKISLKRIMPLSTTLNMNTNAQMLANIPNSQQAMRMDQKISMEMSIQSK